MKYIYLIVLLFLIITSASAQAETVSFPPWDFGRSESSQSDLHHEKVRSDSGGFDSPQMLSRIARLISSVDGDRCSMYPTCTDYAIQAIRKHGFFIGSVMASDRLIHESDESGLTAKIEIGNRVRAYDPIRANDFWWYREADKKLKNDN
jgi:hypothetical protein